MKERNPQQFLGWRMVTIAFVSYNAGIGLTSGSFGTVMPALQVELGASRGEVSTAYGVMLLAIGILAPVIGNIVTKVSLRIIMPIGSILSAIGFLWLAYADSLTWLLVAFGTLVGGGACLMGVIAAPTLVSRWFDRGRGKALGIAMMPLAILIAPPITAILVKAGGSRLVFLSLAALFVCLSPGLALLVVDKPPAGQRPLGNESVLHGTDAPAAEAPKTTRAIVTDIRFWLLSVCIGILAGSGAAFVSNGAGMAMERGSDLTAAATVVSAYGFGTLIGALSFGWLIDRIGPFHSLASCVALQVLVWLLVYGVSSMPLMLIASVALGTAGGSTAALHSAAMTGLFGSASFSRAMGYSYVLKIPFLVGAAPMAGYLFDKSGSYASTDIVFVAGLAFALVLSIQLIWSRGRTAISHTPATWGNAAGQIRNTSIDQQR